MGIVRLLAALVALVSLWSGPSRSAFSAERSPLSDALARTLDTHPTAKRSTVTLKVVDLATGETLFDRHGDHLLVPASNLKIYTAACALDLFGPTHRFTTTLQARGALRDGVLTGNLVLVGGGDSMLTHEQLAEFARRAVAEWSLREIRGEVLVDNSRYAPRLKGPGWMWDDEPDYYNMSVTPLMLDFNLLTVRAAQQPGGVPAAAFVPPSDAPELRQSVSPEISAPRITRAPFTEPVVVELPTTVAEPVEDELTMHDPGPWAAGVLRAMLVDAGVHMAPNMGRNERPGAAAVGVEGPVAAESSLAGPPLAETIDHFHAVSENAVGEVLLHEIAIRQGAERPDWPDGSAAITAWLQDAAGLPAGSFRLVDGSGLSRYNLISADSAVRLLAFMKQHEHGGVFFDSLTKYKLDDATAADAPVVIAAKSGGMQSVSTISGYLRTRRGQLLAFSLLANGYIGDNAPVFDLRQKVWRLLADYDGQSQPQ